MPIRFCHHCDKNIVIIGRHKLTCPLCEQKTTVQNYSKPPAEPIDLGEDD